MSAIDDLIKADQKSPKTIAVIGDAMLDVYVYGELVKTCQENCAKFVESHRVQVPGGAANAARSLAHWKSTTQSLLVRDLGPVKTRFIANGNTILRHDNDMCCFDGDIVRSAAISCLYTNPPDAVLICDYDKGLVTNEFIADVVRYCQIRGILCLVDPKKPAHVYAHSTVILKCNEEYASKHYIPASQLSVVTRGSLLPVSRFIDVYGATHPVNCLNHVGAGDCFAAHLALAMAHGLSFRDSIAIAHSAGRVYVQKPHNEPPLVEEIKRDIEHQP